MNVDIYSLEGYIIKYTWEERIKSEGVLAHIVWLRMEKFVERKKETTKESWIDLPERKRYKWNIFSPRCFFSCWTRVSAKVMFWSDAERVQEAERRRRAGEEERKSMIAAVQCCYMSNEQESYVRHQQQQQQQRCWFLRSPFLFFPSFLFARVDSLRFSLCVCVCSARHSTGRREQQRKKGERKQEREK